MFDDDGETAIEHALALAHPGAEPRRFDFQAGAGDLVGCLAIRVEDPVPHWLVVSRGFTELGEKVEEDPELSGWGFELTCRVPVQSERDDLGWIARWMNSVAAYLADKITFLEPYQHMLLTPPANDGELGALVVVEDPELLPTQSQNGAFSFFQMVGLATDEYEALQEWDARALVDLIRVKDPLFLMDPKRASFMHETAFASAVAEGRERDGSSTGVRYGVPILWFLDHRDIDLHLSVDAVRIVKAAAKNRLAHGNPMVLFGDRRKSVRPDGSLVLRSQVNVSLQPEEGISAVDNEDGNKLAVIRLSEAAIAELATVLKAKPGTYVLPALPRVRFVVVTAKRFSEPTYPA